METETTTEAVTPATGAEPTAQPVEQHTEAVTTTPEPTSTDPTTETPSESVTTETTPAAESGTDITEWLSKKGIDPTSPEALAKVAEMARNSEKAMHKSSQERAEAQRQLTSAFENTADPNDPTAWMAGQVQELKLKDMARDFVDRHPDAKDDLAGMASYLKENPNLMALTEASVLTLDQVHAMYVNSPAQADKLKEQGGQEALKKLANKQRAAAVTGAASSPAPTSQSEEDLFLKGFNSA